MGKHKNKEFKYHYIMRYLNGESPIKLGIEINPWIKYPGAIVPKWTVAFIECGKKGLESQTGKAKGKGQGRPKKNKLPNYEEMSKEELIEYLKIKDIYIDEINKLTRPRFKYPVITEIRKEFKLSLKRICFILSVSPSGYYKWLKSPKTEANYDQGLLDMIQDIYKQNHGNYGAERIMGSLYNLGIHKNIKTVRRYMDKLELQSEIRNPKNSKKRKKKEVKDTKDIRINYINCLFGQNTSRIKLYTDTSQWYTPTGKIYFSAVIGSDGFLYSLTASYRNNKSLVMEDIEKACRSVGRKFFMQFDNAAFYKGADMGELISKYKGIQSFGKAGESKANWPIENFWSILKQEFLRILKVKNLKEAQKKIPSIIFEYNHRRIQKKFNWNTPAKARV